MPLGFLSKVSQDGIGAIPYWKEIKQFGPWIIGAMILKRYFEGSRNTWERDMHGIVVMITGGTSGIGAEVVEDLAKKGAQIVLLVRSTSDDWLVENIDSLRERTGNRLIYAEECDLSNLNSVRKFATKWLDNLPVRRLDMVICCAGVMMPPFHAREMTQDGLEQQWQVNYVAHFHLLTLLMPAIKAQPLDRDIRVITVTCDSYTLADFDIKDPGFTHRVYPSSQPWKVFGASKLALMMFMSVYQDKFAQFLKEKEKQRIKPIRCLVVNPHIARTHMTRRFISMGSVWGLILYAILWPLWYFFLKAPLQAAQSILNAAMSPEYLPLKEEDGAAYVVECSLSTRKEPRSELYNDDLKNQLYQYTENQIAEAEKQSAKERARRKQQNSTPEEKNSKTASGNASAANSAKGKEPVSTPSSKTTATSSPRSSNRRKTSRKA